MSRVMLNVPESEAHSRDMIQERSVSLIFPSNEGSNSLNYKDAYQEERVIH